MMWCCVDFCIPLLPGRICGHKKMYEKMNKIDKLGSEPEEEKNLSRHKSNKELQKPRVWFGFLPFSAKPEQCGHHEDCYSCVSRTIYMLDVY